MASSSLHDEAVGFHFYAAHDDAMETVCSLRVLSLKNRAAAIELLGKQSFTTGFPLQPGWYNLHTRHERHIVGRILFGQPLLHDAGRSYGVQEWQPLNEPVTFIGKSGLVWFTKDTDLATRLRAALATATIPSSVLQPSGDHLATETVNSCGLYSNRKKWVRRLFPRRRRSDLGMTYQTVTPPPQLLRMRRGPLNEDGVHQRPRADGIVSRRRAAKAPATQPLSDDGATLAHPTRSVAQASTVINRLRAGRTLSQLHILMDWNLFHKPSTQDDLLPLSPRPGLFALIQSTHPVFIISIYSRYGANMAGIHLLSNTKIAKCTAHIPGQDFCGGARWGRGLAS